MSSESLAPAGSLDDLRPNTASTYASIKKKLHNLESFRDESGRHLANLEERLGTMEKGQTEAGDNTSQLLKEMYDKIMAEFREVQDEMQHKFASQVAENKRLQSHLTNAKNEMNAMHKRIVALEERVRHLELDIGEDEK